MAIAVGAFLYEVIKAEGTLFASPFLNRDMLWIIIPVYLSWFFSEFWQEKRGTSLGNAISNGGIALWVGADWSRTTFRLQQQMSQAVSFAFIAKIFLSVAMFLYGFFIIIEGIKARRSTHIIGRIRVVTYFILMLTPIFYGSIAKEHYLHSIIAVIFFFPVFYYLIELIDFITPDNTAIKEEREKSDQVNKSMFAREPLGSLSSPLATLDNPFLPGQATGMNARQNQASLKQSQGNNFLPTSQGQSQRAGFPSQFHPSGTAGVQPMPAGKLWPDQQMQKQQLPLASRPMQGQQQFIKDFSSQTPQNQIQRYPQYRYDPFSRRIQPPRY